MKDFARSLCNALEWAEARGVDLMHADYVEVLIGRYQEEMVKGIWSAGNSELSASTVNARVQIALEFGMWAQDKGLREAFIVPTVTRSVVVESHTNSRSHEAKEVKSRLGKVKVNKRILSFPSLDEIKAWRQRVKEYPNTGDTDALFVDLILNTAIRREEAACWRVDTLPLDPRDWKIINRDQPQEYQSVVVTLRYGTKGRQFGIDEHGDKIGPEGQIHIPLWLAQCLHKYRENQRVAALMKKVKTGKTVAEQKRLKQEAVHLILDPQTGERYNGERIYTLWSRRVEGPPHWSPHLGRDWWACTHLEERMKQHADLIKKVLATPNISPEHPLVLQLRDTAQTVIQMEIQPQLRHAYSQTSEKYLQWLFAKLRAPLSMTRQWVDSDNETGSMEACDE
jgi:integrase